MPESDKSTRYYAIDILRGVSILLMVAHHIGYDLVVFGYAPFGLVQNPLVLSLQLLFQVVFVAISGAASLFSRSNVRRGCMMLACGLGITAVTYCLDPQLYTKFGILHFLGCAALLFELLRTRLERIRVHGFIWLALFALAYFPLQRAYPVSHLWLFGLYNEGFRSLDYFPMIPWFFAYLFGVWLGGVTRSGRMPVWFYRLRSPFFEVVGSHTLLIFLLHQPLIYGILLLLGK